MSVWLIHLYMRVAKKKLEALILERAKLTSEKEECEERWLELNDELEAAQAQ